MALTRRSGSRLAGNIWPGFVDAMTALLLILFFVLSIFMIVQFVLRDQVTTKDQELDVLGGQLQQLGNALGLEQQRVDQLETQVSVLDGNLSDADEQANQQAALIASLTDQRDTQAEAIASFEEQVAGLIARNTDLDTALADSQTALETLQDDNSQQISANRALELSLAQARAEVDEGEELARLAAARREALEAMIADLETQAEEVQANLADVSESLTETEAARLAEAAAAEALRERLGNSDAELTAMTLSLEAERQRAEDTLGLLAAARAAQAELEANSAEQTTALDAERDRATEREALLAFAREQLAQEQSISSESQQQVELLNQQSTALNRQLNELQGLLDAAKDAEADAQVQIQSLGSDLNTALARVAAEQRRLADEQRLRADLEEAERIRLEEEARDLASYRSEFFGRVREILGDRDGIQIVGDRFVFSSEVLFDTGSATLGGEGEIQLADVASVIREIRAEIPDGIDWILRVDGHTDNTPIGGGVFQDNWDLSQARALSVVRYLVDTEDLPANRLSANGFGEFQPVDPSDTPEARARNRRIELKFTER